MGTKGMDFGFTFGSAARPGGVPRRRDPDEPFRLLVLGDFSGRGPDGRKGALGERRIRKIDVDELDDAVAGMGVRPRLSSGEEPAIDSFDSLHTDALYDAFPVFVEVRKLRGRLLDAATARSAAAEVRAWAGLAEGDAPEAPGPTAGAEPADTLEDLLGGKPVTNVAGAGGGAAGGLDDMIRRIVAPHIVQARDASHDRLVEMLDDAAAGHMRAVLADPAFRAVETAWRAIHLLITSIETDEESLTVHIADVAMAEMEADLVGADGAGMRRLVVERSVGSAGAPRWSAICIIGMADATERHAKLTARLGALGAAAGAPVLMGAGPAMVGCPSFATHPDPSSWTASPEEKAAEAWAALASSEVAKWVCLAAPRFLLRAPYGAAHEPTERFAFEEVPGMPGAAEDAATHELFLWCPASVACAWAMARAHGGGGGLGAADDFDGLPLVAYKLDGESRMKPIAEAWLTDRAAAAIAARGVTPILSIRGRDAVRIAGVRTYGPE